MGSSTSQVPGTVTLTMTGVMTVPLTLTLNMTLSLSLYVASDGLMISPHDYTTGLHMTTHDGLMISPDPGPDDDWALGDSSNEGNYKSGRASYTGPCTPTTRAMHPTARVLSTTTPVATATHSHTCSYCHPRL